MAKRGRDKHDDHKANRKKEDRGKKKADAKRRTVEANVEVAGQERPDAAPPVGARPPVASAALAPQARPATPAAGDLLRRPAPRRKTPAATLLAGLVVDLFGRRFTLEADGARRLVDLGRRGAALAKIAPAQTVIVTGRVRDGEFKAWMIETEGAPALVLRKARKSRRLIAARQTPQAPAPDA